MLTGEILIRLGVAFLLGGLVGFEREVHGRPAGLRTHILVGFGSALIMVVSIYGFQGLGQNFDPGRIAAQVVSGIGFLGAGTILREGLTIKGLTTAASLWMVAAIGLAVGVGMHFIAIVATLASLVVLNLLHPVENRFELGRQGYELEVRVLSPFEKTSTVMELIQKYDGKITQLEVGPQGSTMHLNLKLPRQHLVQEVLKEISGLERPAS